jgi:hypothetical protein
MTLPVGTQVRTLVPLADYEPGVVTTIAFGPEDVVPGYKRPVSALGGFFGERYDYGLSLTGRIGRPILVAHNEVEVVYG